MPFTTEQLESLAEQLRADILRRVSPFLQKGGKLPGCVLRFCNSITQAAPGAELGRINGFVFSACQGSSENGDFFISDGASLLLVSRRQRCLELCAAAQCTTTQAATLLLHGYQYLLPDAGGLLLHGAAVQLLGEGIVFCGVPGAGKSTQSRLWQQYLQAEPINNDQPGLVFEGGQALVTGSPWSGKEPCYRNIDVPLRAIVFVEQAQENSAILLSPAEAYSRLFLNNYLFPVCQETERCYAQRIERIANTVPAVLLRCTISEAAVKAAFSTIFADRKYHEVRRMKYQASKNFELKNVAGDWLLLPRGTFSIDYSAVVVFNETGRLLWRKLSEPTTAEELSTTLAEHYSIPSEQAAQDVAAFLQKMQDNQLLTLS